VEEWGIGLGIQRGFLIFIFMEEEEGKEKEGVKEVRKFRWFDLFCFALGFVGEGVWAGLVMPIAVSMGISYSFPLHPLVYNLANFFCLLILLSFISRLLCVIGVQTFSPSSRSRRNEWVGYWCWACIPEPKFHN